MFAGSEASQPTGAPHPGCEADQTHPSGAEIKTGWSYSVTGPYMFTTCKVRSNQEELNEQDVR